MPVLPDSGTPAPPASELVPWVPAEDLNCSPCDVPGLTPDKVARAATTVADNLSGHQFGLRNLALRPQTNSPACGCVCNCRCGRASYVVVTLPIWEIVSVTVDGDLLTDADWTVYGDNRMVRLDGGDFPCCQNIRHDPATEHGTCEIVGTFGTPPDDMAQLAVQEIACEIVNAFSDPESCKLTKKTQSFTRQQLQVDVSEPLSTLAAGYMNLPMVDMWLGSLDADSIRRPGRAIDLSQQTAWRPA